MILLKEMPQMRLLPNEINFSASISACATGTQWEVALSELREMPQLRLLPNEISFSTGINACKTWAQ